MRAVLRRHQGRAISRIVSGEIELDTETHELSQGDIVQILPAREYALMHALMERPGRILSRAQIEERIYGWGEEVESNAVDVLIHSIRRKYGKDVILNVRGPAGCRLGREHDFAASHGSHLDDSALNTCWGGDGLHRLSLRDK